MTKISHPNILRLRGIIVDSHADKDCKGIVLDEMACNLHNVIYDSSYSPFEYYNQIGSWFSQAASGLSYLHRKEIVHQDIKPQKAGTLRYQAPEMIAGKEFDQYCAQYADVYSFGITMYEIYYRRKPFEKLKELSNYELAMEIVNGRRPMDVRNTVITADPLCLYYCLLPRLWCSNPSHRLSMETIKELFFHSRDYKYLQGVLGRVT